jgi:hypothetical protein
VAADSGGLKFLRARLRRIDSRCGFLLCESLRLWCGWLMATAPDQLPDDVDALKAALIEAHAKLSGAHALIEHLQLMIDKMKRAMFGPRSERSQRLLDQLELQLEETAAAASEDEVKAQSAGIRVESFVRRKATRRDFPGHLPRRRIVYRRRRRARAAAQASSPRSAKTSPRHSTWCRGNGS